MRNEAEDASFLFCLNRKRAHTSAKGGPSAGVEAVDDNDSYDDSVASARQLYARGCKPKIAGGGPLKKAQSRETSSFFRLNPMRAHASTKGGGSAGVDTVNEDDSYDDKDDDVASNGHQKTGRGSNNPAVWAGNGHPGTH